MEIDEKWGEGGGRRRRKGRARRKRRRREEEEVDTEEVKEICDRGKVQEKTQCIVATNVRMSMIKYNSQG